MLCTETLVLAESKACTPDRLGSKAACKFTAYELLHSDTILQCVLSLLPNLEVSAWLLKAPVAKVAATSDRRTGRNRVLVVWVGFWKFISHAARQ